VKYQTEKFVFVAEPTPEGSGFSYLPTAIQDFGRSRAAKGLKAGGPRPRGGWLYQPAVMFQILGLDGKVIKATGGEGGAQAVAKGPR